MLEHAWVVLGPLSYSFTPVAWCSAVVTLYTRGGILMEGADVPLLIANFAGVAVYASQECVSVLTSLFLKLTVWICSSREELVADFAL